MSAPILFTKFQAPPTRRELVARPRLISKINAGLNRRLTLVLAPAGSGKTTLLSDWSNQCQCSSVWISLNPINNDPYRFFSELITGLNLLQTRPDSAEHFLPPPSPIRDALTTQNLEFVAITLINELSAFHVATPPLVIIFDDYHVIETEAIHQAMSFLLDNLPRHVHFVLASRAEPHLPLARLRARGYVTELRDTDLKFNQAEVAHFMKNLLGVNLTVNELTILDEKIEGWVAGLQLAALILQGNKNVRDLVNALSGSNRYIFDYLADEVLFCQPEPIQKFILEISILDRFNAALCHAVTGYKDSQSILEQLERNNLFVIPLDEEQTWFRFHHLFVDLLRLHLKRISGKELPKLHIRASEWFTQNRMPYESISHALMAEDYELAKDLIEETDSSITLRGEIKTITAWLDELPPKLVRSSPRLSIIYAWALLLTLDIDYMEARLNDAIRALGLPRNFWTAWPANLSERDEGILGEVVALSMCVAASRGNPEQAIHLAEQGLENIGEDNVLCRGVITEILGDVYRDMGHVPLAVSAYSDSINYGQSASNELAKMTSLDGIAWMRLAEGNLTQAEALFRQVIEWQTWQGQPLLPIAKSCTGLGLLLKERNDLVGAEHYLLQGVTQCELGGYVRHLLTALSGLANLKVAKGEISEALAIAKKAIQLARNTSLDWTLSNVLALHATILLHPDVNNFPAALQWLDTCGLRTTDAPEHLKEMEHLAFVRVHLARSRRGFGKDKLPDLLVLLERLLTSAKKQGRRRSQISMLLLQALVSDETGQTSKALILLDKAIGLAISDEIKGVFLDEGIPMKMLLQKELARGIHTNFIEELLAYFGETGKLPALPELTDALTEREIEVLRLMAHGLTNREICAELNISSGTANTHAQHLFRKLGIHNRRQATARAKEMGLVR